MKVSEEEKYAALVKVLFKQAERHYIRLDDALKRSMLEDVKAAHVEMTNDIMTGEKNSKFIFGPETMQLMRATHAAFKVVAILDGVDGD